MNVEKLISIIGDCKDGDIDETVKVDNIIKQFHKAAALPQFMKMTNVENYKGNDETVYVDGRTRKKTMKAELIKQYNDRIKIKQYDLDRAIRLNDNPGYIKRLVNAIEGNKNLIKNIDNDINDYYNQKVDKLDEARKAMLNCGEIIENIFNDLKNPMKDFSEYKFIDRRNDELEIPENYHKTNKTVIMVNDFYKTISIHTLVVCNENDAIYKYTDVDSYSEEAIYRNGGRLKHHIVDNDDIDNPALRNDIIKYVFNDTIIKNNEYRVRNMLKNLDEFVKRFKRIYKTVSNMAKHLVEKNIYNG